MNISFGYIKFFTFEQAPQKSMIWRDQCHQNCHDEILLIWISLDQLDRMKHPQIHLKFHILGSNLDMGYNQIFLRG